jgi:hypothetical protein
MLITLFGDLTWKDDKGLLEWLAAHDLKHQALAQALGRAGVTSPVFLLSQRIDDSWLQTHWTHHHLLALQFAPDSDSSSYDLQEDPMQSEDAFYQWHNIHNLIHQRLDQAFGITGT